MSKIIYLSMIITLTFSVNVFAQIATGSFFREMKSINPATISKRPAAVISFNAGADRVKKEKDISSFGTYGEGSVESTVVDIQKGRVFYGGDGGSLSSEILVEIANGKKKDSVKSATENYSGGDSVSSKFANYGLSLGENFGVSLGHLQFKYENKQSGSFGGSTFSFNSVSDSKAYIIKGGTSFNLLLDFGLFYEFLHVDIDMDMDGVTSKSTFNERTVGVALGISLKSFHLEGAYERKLTPQEDILTGKKYYGDRISGSIECKIGPLALGYTGRYYREGFFGLEGLLYNTLVYSGIRDPRLEHIVNFSLGGDKGHSVSGSAYYGTGKSEEDMALLKTGMKFDTTITSMGVGAKYTYSF